jgi:hypothetical protein
VVGDPGESACTDCQCAVGQIINPEACTGDTLDQPTDACTDCPQCLSV